MAIESDAFVQTQFVRPGQEIWNQNPLSVKREYTKFVFVLGTWNVNSQKRPQSKSGRKLIGAKKTLKVKLYFQIVSLKKTVISKKSKYTSILSQSAHIIIKEDSRPVYGKKIFNSFLPRNFQTKHEGLSRCLFLLSPASISADIARR